MVVRRLKLPTSLKRFSCTFFGDQAGFTYLTVLLLLVLISLGTLKAGEAWSHLVIREREQRLLLAGSEIRSAIKSYYEGSPGAVKQYPTNLQALLLDRRYLSVRRYLRKIPLDPMTGQADWVLIPANDGGILGVHSRGQLYSVRDANAGLGINVSVGGDVKGRFVYIPNK